MLAYYRILGSALIDALFMGASYLGSREVALHFIFYVPLAFFTEVFIGVLVHMEWMMSVNPQSLVEI